MWVGKSKSSAASQWLNLQLQTNTGLLASLLLQDRMVLLEDFMFSVCEWPASICNVIRKVHTTAWGMGVTPSPT